MMMIDKNYDDDDNYDSDATTSREMMFCLQLAIMLIQDDETASEYQMVLIEEVDENLSVSRIAWRVSLSGSCDGEME